jgi:hypothetical protein
MWMTRNWPCEIPIVRCEGDVRLRGRREVSRRGSKLSARQVKTYKHTIATSLQDDGKDDYLGDVEEVKSVV